MNDGIEQQDISSEEGHIPIRKQYTIKDKWDKWNIFLSPMGGIITAGVIAGFGFFGSHFLNERQENEINMRLYSELMSQREESENKLKSEMFQQIFKSFLEPNQNGAIVKKIAIEQSKSEFNTKLILVKKELLQLELLTRNFHESIDVKPIFKKILFSILDLKRPLREIEKRLKDEKKVNADDVRKLRKVNRQLKNLKSIAGRISRKQLEVLSQKTNIIEIPVPYSDLCIEKKPFEKFKEQKCSNKGKSVSRELTFRLNKDESKSRKFTIDVKYAFPEWGQVYLSVKAEPIDGESVDCSKAESKYKVDNICKEFWVSRFDFPLVDNTYLSNQERYGVALNGIDEKNKILRFAIVYFPSSYSGLKEKSFYHQKVLNHLETWSFMKE